MNPTGGGDGSTGTDGRIRQQDLTDTGAPSGGTHAAAGAPALAGRAFTPRPPKPAVIPPSVTIVVPAPPVPVGTSFNVSIQVNEGTDWVWVADTERGGEWVSQPIVSYQGGFNLQFDTGETASSSNLGTPASVTLNRAGIHVATASAPTTTKGDINQARHRWWRARPP